jgi:hypothetical protein
MSTLFNRLASPPAPGKGNCPYLGIAEDPQTCLAYASEWNLCHHVRRPSAVKLEHQRSNCLLGTHTACPVFQSAQAALLPARLRGRRAQAGLGKWAPLLVLLVTGLFLAAWALWWRSAEIPSSAALGPSPEATRADSPQALLPAVAGEPAGAAGPTPLSPISFQASFTAPAPMPASSATLSAPTAPTAWKRCGYALEASIEIGQNGLVLHRVRSGENMLLLAEKYGTSIQAIRAVNYFLPSPLWADLVIVIPVGSPEGAGALVLEPYQVPEPGVSIESLAGQFSLTTVEFAQSNDLDMDCPAISGWVLVPHPARVDP